MNILVTGANGFCGQIIAKFLLDSGHKVYSQIREGAESPSIIAGIENIHGWNIGDIEVDVIVNTVGKSPDRQIL